MGFLDNLKKFFTEPTSDSGSRFAIFKVVCDNCGEEITVRASKTSDISRLYEGEGPPGAEYFLRKEILGSKCNKLIYINVFFNSSFGILSKEINGGKFIE